MHVNLNLYIYIYIYIFMYRYKYSHTKCNFKFSGIILGFQCYKSKRGMLMFSAGEAGAKDLQVGHGGCVHRCNDLWLSEF